MTPYFPIFIDLTRRNALVVGGGAVGTAKVEQLLAAQAEVTVVSPAISQTLQDYAWRGRITWKARPFKDSDLAGFLLVIAATDQEAVNARVFQLAEGRNMLANSVDDLANCNFTMAAVAQAGPVQVAVSSSGVSPTLARRLRDRIQSDLLAQGVDKLARFLGAWRPRLSGGLRDFNSKRRFWNAVLDSPIPELVTTGQERQADEQILALWAHESGRVWEPVGSAP